MNPVDAPSAWCSPSDLDKKESDGRDPLDGSQEIKGKFSIFIRLMHHLYLHKHSTNENIQFIPDLCTIR